MIKVSDKLSLHDNELHFDFIRSTGPGGQNVNKVATAVQLRFNIAASASLSEDVKVRLKKIAGRKITDNGVLIIEARRFRSQQKNRQDAIDRLTKLIAKAEIVPKKRIKTKPSKSAKEKRLQDKQHRSKIKQGRTADPSSFE